MSHFAIFFFLIFLFWVMGKGYTPLHIACQLGYIHIVELLMPLVVSDDDLRNSQLQTPLHLATAGGQDFFFCVLVIFLNNFAKQQVTLLWFASCLRNSPII